MSKSFRDDYYEYEDWKIKKIKKSYKQKRQKVKDYLKRIDTAYVKNSDDIDDTEEFQNME
jgi:hypothetical protein